MLYRQSAERPGAWEEVPAGTHSGYTETEVMAMAALRRGLQRRGLGNTQEDFDTLAMPEDFNGEDNTQEGEDFNAQTQDAGDAGGLQRADADFNAQACYYY